MEMYKNIRKEFINYFNKKNHINLPPSPLILKDENTLFTVAGMKQFSNIFLGHEKSKIPCATTIQPCLRMGGKHNDYDTIGTTSRHLTLFEMMGNFSFQNYFKEEAIFYAYDFLINVLNIDIKHLYITVFHTDTESYNIWKKLINEEKIIYIETSDNFWKSTEYGPCGPCSEIYYDTKENNNLSKESIKNSIIKGEERFLEIWNLVFMQYNETPEGLINLDGGFIDTGMGLERITSVLNKSFDNFQSPGLKKTFNFLYEQNKNIYESRIVADHMRSILFLINEGLRPGGEFHEYALRKLIRRASLYYKDLGSLVNYVIEDMPDYFFNLDKVLEILEQEIDYFYINLKKCENLILKEENINEDFIFKMYETYGMPLDISQEILKDRKIDWNQVNQLKKNHQEKSRQKLNVHYNVCTNICYYDNLHIKTDVQFLSSYDENKYDYAGENSIKNDNFLMITKESCFYPTGGGQCGDIGIFFNSNGQGKILNTIKQNITPDNFIVIHICSMENGFINLGDSIEIQVDKETRNGRTRAHSATHLFGEYFMKKYEYTQAGSFVDNDYFRLDLKIDNISNKNCINEEEIEEGIKYIEDAIRQQIKTDIKYENFNEIKNTLTLVGYEYGNTVRVVNFPEYSRQLCGGTHVKNTSEILKFQFIKESSIKKGIRRIEAIVGQKALDYKAPIIKNEKKEKITVSLDPILEESIVENYKYLILKNVTHLRQIEKYIHKENYDIIFFQIENNINIICINIEQKILLNIKNKYNLKGGGKDIYRMGTCDFLDFYEVIKDFNSHKKFLL
jgi:alanyl-tRNA synthetase